MSDEFMKQLSPFRAIKDLGNADFYKKITHSTKPLEEICCTPKSQISRYVDCNSCDRKQLGFDKIKPLSLLEVEEAIYGYSVWKMAKEHEKFEKETGRTIEGAYCSKYGYILGFEACKELIKDKLFTLEDMLNFSWWLSKNLGQYSSDERAHFELKYLNQWKSFNTQKNEWDIEFINGKIKLV